MYSRHHILSHIFAVTLLAASGAVGAQAPSTSSGQAYPNKPVRIIVPFPPGGANDIATRTLNIRLPALLGQNLIIDNRPGAGGNIGAEITAKSPPDGYTLLMANNSLITNASLYRKLPYDPFRDFIPISIPASCAPSPSPARSAGWDCPMYRVWPNPAIPDLTCMCG